MPKKPPDPNVTPPRVPKKPSGSNAGPPSTSPGALDLYRQKRDPTRTPEPFQPERSAAPGATFRGSFVVHLHEATRTHYDVRLEIGGALESFAVPKGPSLDPDVKHLAIHTETHPLDYVHFEDVIPAGNYGAGPMIVWDTGAVRYLEGSAQDGVARGKIDFELSGFKLRGRFALVATGRRKGDDKQWLFFKKKDAHARPGSNIVEEAPHSVLSCVTVHELGAREQTRASFMARAVSLGAVAGDVDASRIEPMLCALVDEPPFGDERWLYELKLDGVRIVADKRRSDVRLYYRSGRGATAFYPEIAAAIAKMLPERLVLDGEIVAFDEQGRPSFQRLGSRMHSQPTSMRAARYETPVAYLVFDILAIDGHDTRGMPIEARKKLLADVVRGRGFVRVLDYLDHRGGPPLFAFCAAQGLEGIVAKRLGSTYKLGPKRTGDWLKIKRDREESFVVVGFTKGSGARDRLGALDLATWDGQAFVVRGKVGSGLDESMIDALLARLSTMRVDAAMAQGRLEPAPRGRTFVKPEVVVSVRFHGFTDDGHVRHPVIQGIREDVAPTACTVAPHALPDAADTEPDEGAEDDAPDTASTASKATAAATAGVTRAKLTNPKKIFFPDDGYTKADLYAYYGAIAHVMVPHLRGRPAVLVRYPDGITGKSFFQWNAPAGLPSWVKTLALDKHEGERTVQAFLIDDVDTLLYVANLGCIPIHILASRAGSRELCEFVTIDFDLGGGTLRDAIVLAHTLREIVTSAGLEAFPKTSGQTGLHVLVPVGPGVPFDAATMIAELLGRLVVARHPEIATMQRMKNKRGTNKVYVDTDQTGRSRTIVAPYSVRAVAGATVSTPLAWEEVGHALDPKRFTISTVPERAAQIDDPMRGMLTAAPNLPAALVALEASIRALGSKSPAR